MTAVRLHAVLHRLIDQLNPRPNRHVIKQEFNIVIAQADAGWGRGGHEPLSRNRAEFESDRKVPLPMTSALRDFTQGPGVSPAQVEQTLQRRFIKGIFAFMDNGSPKKILSNNIKWIDIFADFIIPS